MMERVWPGAVVGEGTIHVHISAVRKALGPDRAMLKTVSGRGYHLLVVMNAEAALRLLLSQPTDTEAVRRLLDCIVKDGMRTGDIVNRTRALIKESAVTEGMPRDQRGDPRGHRRNPR
jgi:hypothetical protein